MREKEGEREGLVSDVPVRVVERAPKKRARRCTSFTPRVTKAAAAFMPREGGREGGKEGRVSHIGWEGGREGGRDLPSPKPSHMPAAMAITFLTAPPTYEGVGMG